MLEKIEWRNPNHNLRLWFFSFIIFLRFSCPFKKRTCCWISSSRRSLCSPGRFIASDIISSVSSHIELSSDNSNKSSKFVEKMFAKTSSAANEIRILFYEAALWYNQTIKKIHLHSLLEFAILASNSRTEFSMLCCWYVRIGCTKGVSFWKRKKKL